MPFAYSSHIRSHFMVLYSLKGKWFYFPKNKSFNFCSEKKVEKGFGFYFLQENWFCNENTCLRTPSFFRKYINIC